jgi:16S rRNA (guanine(966)-N(2))-methyltransferase RsmD
MRVTGGILKGMQFPPGFAAHVRPSTDRVRESLFNQLIHRYDLNGMEVLDLFSGSGIIAAEFFSRGVNKVFSVDLDFKNISYQKARKKERELLENWQITKADVFKWLKNDDKKYDIIFADPPYGMPDLNLFPLKVAERLRDDGILIFEHQPNLSFSLFFDHQKEYGSTTISIFVASQLKNAK